MKVRKYTNEDLPQMTDIWNDIVEQGIAFPQDVPLGEDGEEFFAGQTYCGVADGNGEIAGLYILHPNNVGRCGHICNASYAVKNGMRGMHIGEALVCDCMVRAKESGFKILQFNAVVKTNIAARRLYEKLGFVLLGVIPDGFRMKSGEYEDIISYYKTL